MTCKCQLNPSPSSTLIQIVFEREGNSVNEMKGHFVFRWCEGQNIRTNYGRYTYEIQIEKEEEAGGPQSQRNKKKKNTQKGGKAVLREYCGRCLLISTSNYLSFTPLPFNITLLHFQLCISVSFGTIAIGEGNPIILTIIFDSFLYIFTAKFFN